MAKLQDGLTTRGTMSYKRDINRLGWNSLGVGFFKIDSDEMLQKAINALHILETLIFPLLSLANAHMVMSAGRMQMEDERASCLYVASGTVYTPGTFDARYFL